MRRWIVWIVWLPLAVQAGDDLNQANRLLEDMEYNKARNLANRVLKSSVSGPEELASAYRIRGLSLSALGKSSAALEDFKRLLAIDPQHKLSDAISPKLAAPFYQAVAMAKSSKPLRLDHTVPASPESFQELRWKVRLESNPYRLAKKVRLRWWTRRNPKGKSLVSPAKQGADLVFRLRQSVEEDEIFYFCDAVNKHGGTLIRVGSMEEPLRIRLAAVAAKPVATSGNDEEKTPTFVAKRSLEPQPEDKTGPVNTGDSIPEEEETHSVSPWYTTWWFWTAVGVVAAAGVTTGTVLALQTGGDSGPANYEIRFR